MGDPILAESGSESDIQNSLERSSLIVGKWKQFYACLAMSLLSISKGLAYGWSSPLILILQSNRSPVGPMNDSQIGFLQTIPALASVAGVVLVTATLSKLGIKLNTCIFAVSIIIGWFILLFSTSPLQLYIGRFFTAIALAPTDLLSSYFLSGIAHDSIRGTIITFSQFGGQLGFLLGFFFGAVCNYKVFNGICLIPPALFLICFFWVPESPPCLIRMNRLEAAKKSYMWYHGVSEESAMQYISRTQGARTPTENIYNIFTEKSNQQLILIMFFLFSFSQFCGVSVIPAYTSQIFEKAEAQISPNHAALFTAFTALIISLITSLSIEYCGRRFLMLLSYVMMTCALYVLAAYFICKTSGWIDVRHYAWIVIISLSVYAASSAIGISSVAPTLGAEIVPHSIMGPVWLVVCIISLLMSMVSIQAYTLITSNLSYYLNFVQLAVFSSIGLVIAWSIVPETKGKSLAEITAELSGLKYDVLENDDERISQSVTA